MPRWLIITGIGCGGLLMLVLVGVGTLFFIAVEEELRRGSVEQERIGQEEPVTPNEQPEPEPAPSERSAEAPDTATIRVSGDAAFSCNVGSLGGSRSVEGVLPPNGGTQKYEVPVDAGAFDYDNISAFCWKPGGPGTLTAEIVYDGKVRQEATTSAEHGNLNVSWSPQD